MKLSKIEILLTGFIFCIIAFIVYESREIYKIEKIISSNQKEINS
jgi:hypothetical protein